MLAIIYGENVDLLSELAGIVSRAALENRV